MADFLLPDVGEGLTEAEIVTWHVKVGDVVAVNDPLVDIETAKSIVELPSPFAGTIGALLVAEGDTVAVGTPIIRIDSAEAVAIDPTNPAASGLSEGESLVGRASAPVSRRRHLTARPAVPGTDLPGDRREPIKGVRKAMAEAMVSSAFTAPHVTIWLDVDVTQSLALIEKLRAEPEYAEARPGFLFLTALSCILAADKTPLINSSWDSAAGEVVLHRAVNLGIATATSRGLLVPVIRGAEGLAPPALAAALRESVARARDGVASPTELTGGTFTITDVGPLGIDGGTPIINTGESAILCVGVLRRQPWVVGEGADERLAIRDACTLSLTFDHRHIDGATGAAFLSDVASALHHVSALGLG